MQESVDERAVSARQQGPMPRYVVFVAPFPAEVTYRFLRAVARLRDVRVLGIVHTMPSGDDAKLFHDVVRVTDPLSRQDLHDATALLVRRHGTPHRIVGILEALMVPLGELRTRFGIRGASADVADLFRDKSRMKAALTAAGLPVARNRLLHHVGEGEEFAREVGFPLVLKPPAGMGAKATFRVASLTELRRTLSGMGASREQPVLAEEFLQGREFSFETLTLGGRVRGYSISHYLPSCLEVLENDWMQWTCLLPKDIDGPEYAEATKMGIRAVEALGLEDGMTHMEWFQRPDGSLVIGEIAQRPPGANITRMTGLVNGIDPYRAWARAVVDSEMDAPWRRESAAGCAYLRGMGRGRVSAVHGIHTLHERIGKWVAEARIPVLGAPKSDSYEGDGYVVVQHRKTEAVRGMLKGIIDTVRVHYS
jgi:formate-dependent phosphoribosylglycinamide formyltransferase (GAR transformylase)